MISNRSTIETSARQYSVYESGGLWHAAYRPRNPKTGKLWQASRSITDGYNAWVGIRYSGIGTAISPVQSGTVPAFEVWSATYNGVNAGFATEADAKAAMAGEMARSGK